MEKRLEAAGNIIFATVVPLGYQVALLCGTNQSSGNTQEPIVGIPEYD
jgi:hypothetical protein